MRTHSEADDPATWAPQGDVALPFVAERRSALLALLTTESDAEIKAQAKAAGATGWLTKPFDPEQLVRVVKKVLAK